ncbi:hypothetical protein An07g03650 [Aspergillus niger]|uniref:Uncharacterized protein n=2 Tax=Aspergillus niger TaxID=5061 RepID=A2QMX5_ASPNC|nr:hypothetical protein An07g03650 [Aspergillus niger]CAK48116.1 hypothetical protein An07g03650 [Aspergillus niger]
MSDCATVRGILIRTIEEVTRSGNGSSQAGWECLRLKSLTLAYKPHQDEKLTGSTGSSHARQDWANCGCGAKWTRMDSPRLKAEEIPISTQSPSNNIVAVRTPTGLQETHARASAWPPKRRAGTGHTIDAPKVTTDPQPEIHDSSYMIGTRCFNFLRLVAYPSTAPPGQFRAHHIAPRGCGLVLLALTAAQLFGFSWPVSTPFTGCDLPLDPPFHRWAMEGRPKRAEDAE